MWLEAVRRPDPLDARVAEAGRPAEHARRPMRRRRRFLMQGHVDHPGNLRRGQWLLAPGPRRVPLQPLDAAADVPLSPAVDGLLALAGRAKDRLDPSPVRR